MALSFPFSNWRNWRSSVLGEASFCFITFHEITRLHSLELLKFQNFCSLLDFLAFHVVVCFLILIHDHLNIFFVVLKLLVFCLFFLLKLLIEFDSYLLISYFSGFFLCFILFIIFTVSLNCLIHYSFLSFFFSCVWLFKYCISHSSHCVLDSFFSFGPFVSSFVFLDVRLFIYVF